MHDERWSLAVDTLAQLEMGSNATVVLDALTTKVAELYPESALLQGDLARLVLWMSGGDGESVGSLADTSMAVDGLFPSGETVNADLTALAIPREDAHNAIFQRYSTQILR